MSGILGLLLAAKALRAVLSSFSGATSVNGASTAGFRIDSDGTLYATNSVGTYVSQFVWNPDNSPAANFDFRVTITGGSPGTFSTADAASGVWINLASDRTWTRASGVAGTTQTVNFTTEIRNAATLVVLATSTGTLSAENVL